MSTPPEDPNRAPRRGVYVLLIALATGSMLGRIMAVNSVDRIGLEAHLMRQGREDWRQQRPFLSGNDRSRWLTVRALVEHGTYAIDEVLQEPNWDTIDMVQHPDREGNLRLYSSKPPLLPTLMAAQYWLIHRLTGTTLGTHPYQIGRFMLVTINVLPMILYFAVLARLVERYGATDWGRVLVMAAATGATFLTTFAVVINNHLIAAVSAVVAIDAAIRIWYEGERRLRWFVVAGFFAAFMAANELPAASLAAVLSVAVLWKAPRQTLIAYVPAAAVVAAAFFGTNYIAHGTLRPAYAHRSGEDNWYDYTYERQGRMVESYWRNPRGVDRGEPSVARYAFHVLLGHHGIFSLTPVWLLSVLGIAMYWRRPRPPLAALAAATLLVSAVCLAFYIGQPLENRNYGGMTSGFRWVFWLAPLWLLAMLPAADWTAGARWRRAVAVVLLVMSVLSATYPTWNPWTHPWLYNAWHAAGWLED